MAPRRAERPMRTGGAGRCPVVTDTPDSRGRSSGALFSGPPRSVDLPWRSTLGLAFDDMRPAWRFSERQPRPGRAECPSDELLEEGASHSPGLVACRARRAAAAPMPGLREAEEVSWSGHHRLATAAAGTLLAGAVLVLVDRLSPSLPTTGASSYVGSGASRRWRCSPRRAHERGDRPADATGAHTVALSRAGARAARSPHAEGTGPAPDVRWRNARSRETAVDSCAPDQTPGNTNPRSPPNRLSRPRTRHALHQGTRASRSRVFATHAGQQCRFRRSTPRSATAPPRAVRLRAPRPRRFGLAVSRCNASCSGPRLERGIHFYEGCWAPLTEVKCARRHCGSCSALAEWDLNGADGVCYR
jgi:hypothetical protein